MEHDLQIHTESVDCLRAELRHIADYFLGLGQVECDVLFGFAWRTEGDDSELSWKQVRIPLITLDAEIRKAEGACLGNFGRDDVCVSFEDQSLEVKFCHHSGIHLSFPQPNQITEYFFARWQASSLNPMEREKTEGALTWHRIRGDIA